MSNLRVTTIQSKLVWENIEANLEGFAQKMVSLKNQTDLVVLPEMFTTGFSMKAEALAELMTGKTMAWFTQQAAELNAVVTGSFMAREDDKFHNRLIWMQPDGNFEIYDKRHLFTLAKEHLTFTPGTKKLITTVKGWKVCPLICYDLRFPVWARNVEDYDLLIYMANWPITRSNAWKSLLEARAIENQCFTIGVNCVGEDGMGWKYSGDTSIIDFGGKILNQISNVEGVFTCEINKEEMLNFRKKLNLLADKDDFSINL